MTSRDFNAVLLRAVRRAGRNPRFCALEAAVCKWFLIFFAAVLLTHLVIAHLKGLL